MNQYKILFLIGIIVIMSMWVAAPVSALVPTSCATQSEIPQAECEALVALYNSTAGASWTTKTNWLFYGNVCGWYGVTCTGGHVDTIWLQNNHLAGRIPAALSNLSNLVTLNLHSNLLTGNLPSSVGSLSILASLNIYNNPMMSGRLPLSLTSLSALTSFNFSNTFLCEPPDASYQTWKAGVADYTGSGTVCSFIRSTRFYDGDITERSEYANEGGSYQRNATTLMVGDTAQDQQVDGMLHFNTGAIPDGAMIVDVTLKVKLQSVTGTDPRSTLSYLIVDIAKPYFGSGVDLAAADFQAAPDMKVACTLGVQGAGWYVCHLKAAALLYINKTGFTQFKLRFLVDDNDNGIADLLNIYSGDTGVLSWRPLLSVNYMP